jgi:hypothetical protein
MYGACARDKSPNLPSTFVPAAVAAHQLVVETVNMGLRLDKYVFICA